MSAGVAEFGRGETFRGDYGPMALEMEIGIEEEISRGWMGSEVRDED